MSRGWTIWSIDAEHNYRGLDVAEGANWAEKEAAVAAMRRNESAVRNGMHKLVFVAVPAGQKPTREAVDAILAERPAPPPAPEPARREPQRTLTPDEVWGTITLRKLADGLDDAQLGVICGALGKTRRDRLRAALAGWDR